MADEDKLLVHTDSATQHPDVPTEGPDECPECKVPAGRGFGMAGGGMGVYTYCPNCGKMLSKTQVED